MKLYLYFCCPYCIRVQIVLGYFNLPHEIQVVGYGDVETPTKMIGKKMVPILEFEPGKYMPESLDIIQFLEKKVGKQLQPKTSEEVHKWIAGAEDLIIKLSFPRWHHSSLQEFKSQSDIDYWLKKKGRSIWKSD